MNSILKFILKPFLGKKVFQNFFESLHLLSLKGMNYGYALVSNSGELEVLEGLKGKKDLIVFDVGANVGEYTEAVLKILGANASVYAFEPVSKNFKNLSERFASKPNIKLFNFALGEIKAETEIFLEGSDLGQHSMYQRKVSGLEKTFLPVEKIKVEVLQDFCQEQNIQRIDLLKLDVEGHELAVLKGAGSWLSERKIENIQFEFGGANIDSRTFFRDFYEILTPDYNLYRILQNGLRLMGKYVETDEIFLTGNFLAKKK